MSDKNSRQMDPSDSGKNLAIHHIAIQTDSLDNSVSWYAAYLGSTVSWTLDSFSQLTISRLPGIRRLTEINIGDIRLHLFERDGRSAISPGESVVQFQHVCISVDSPYELLTLRERWSELFNSGEYSFASAEPATAVVTDSAGTQSFYARDVNGLEFEFSYIQDRA